MREHLKHYIDESNTANVRGLRILLEYFYATEIFAPIVRDDIKIVSVFGSARTPRGTREYRDAYQLGQQLYREGYAVVTGGSQGIMEAANHGVADAIAADLAHKKKNVSVEEVKSLESYKKLLNKYSVGLKISLPFEAENNPYVGVYATFHYFMVRKFFFGTLSRAFIACEGGWGTRDELYEILTLVQTGKAPLMPVVYVSTNPKHLIGDLDYTVEKGYINSEDRRLLDIVKTPEAAVKLIRRFYSHIKGIGYHRSGEVRIALIRALTAAQAKRVRALCDRHSEAVGPYRLGKKSIDFLEFPHHSYGYLRRVVDALSE